MYIVNTVLVHLDICRNNDSYNTFWTAGQQSESDHVCQPNQNFSWKLNHKHTTSTVKPFNFTNWAGGEPSCTAGDEQNFTQSYVVLEAWNNHGRVPRSRWLARGCESKYCFMCELPTNM